ncbi:shikimate kinase [Chloroflexota bacterium]
MKSSVALIGFMGTGKTTVGEIIAGKLHKEFVELDTSIEQKAGRAIPEIFQKDGEIVFRALEIEATKEVVRKENTIIACGGGIVLNQINVDRLKQESIIIYLTATPKVILKRTSAQPEKRPLLHTISKPSQVSRFLQFRHPFYERAADITIDTSELSINEVAERVITELQNHEDFSGKKPDSR